ncbi:MAG: hypothetical protein WC860_01470 [Candidatus Margulisiibacteriota bacterium]|jgi:hypothetical protein
MAQLEFFKNNNQLTKELEEILFDSAINNRYPTLKNYLIIKKISYEESDLKQILFLIEKSIFKQVYYYAHLIYYIMEKSSNWGEAGEQQIKLSFCRSLLNKEPDIALAQEDAIEFLDKVEENIEKLEISKLSLDQAKNEFKNSKFIIFNHTFTSYKANEINRILRFLGSDKFLQCGFYGDEKEFIFGKGILEHKLGYDIIFLEKELARTPNNIIAMAAIIGNREIFIRKESLKTIFVQKWMEIFNYDEDEQFDIKTSVYRNISEGIKQKTLSLYGVKEKNDLEKIANEFVSDMGETILYHELGHGITQHDILPLENAAIGEATKIIGENIYTSMLEFLADFAPPFEGIIGPIHNMIQISKKDRARAERMYFMYLSDTWFFDTTDEYMYIYSDLMALILLKYIDVNQQVNFLQLEHDISFEKDRTQKEKLSMFERILELFVWDTQEIKAIAEKAVFNITDNKYDYKKIRGLMLEEFKRNDGFVKTDTYEFLVPFWTNMLGYVIKLSDAADKLKDYIRDQQKVTLMKMLILSCGKKKAESLNYDHRKYIIEQFRELNLLAF